MSKMARPLKANVTVPDVTVSCDNLDFGRVVVGQGKVIATQLWNTSPVVSEWSFKKPLTNAKDLSFFKFSPSSGTLQPGERVNVAVEFTPREGRPFFLKIPIKIVQNPKRWWKGGRGGGKGYHCFFFSLPLSSCVTSSLSFPLDTTFFGSTCMILSPV